MCLFFFLPILLLPLRELNCHIQTHELYRTFHIEFYCVFASYNAKTQYSEWHYCRQNNLQ
ncbi:hypothetical protein B4087_5325 [Bacillus cereus]|nr:hypothetical protein B4087_5325 [Bacillus cereus]